MTISNVSKTLKILSLNPFLCSKSNGVKVSQIATKILFFSRTNTMNEHSSFRNDCSRHYLLMANPNFIAKLVHIQFQNNEQTFMSIKNGLYTSTLSQFNVSHKKRLFFPCHHTHEHIAYLHDHVTSK